MIPYNFDLEHFFRPTLRFFTIPRFVRTDRQTDRRTDRQTDRQGHSNSPPFALQAGKGWTKMKVAAVGNSKDMIDNDQFFQVFS
jgi:hypothetical protein